MSDITYETQGTAIAVTGPDGVKRSVLFDSPVAQVLGFGSTLVVRTEPGPGARSNENVFGVGTDGAIAWQVPRRKHVYEDSPYTGMLALEGKVKLFNWDGLELVVDPATGEVLEEAYGR